MWFKNFRIYRLLKPVADSPLALSEYLEAAPLRDCAKSQQESAGWLPPFAERSDYVHAVGGCWRIVCGRKTRLLPNKIVKQHVDEKLQKIYQAESRKVSRKEKTRIKDDTIMELLPRTFVQNDQCQAYIDTHRQWLVVDTASANRAEWLIHHLREAVGHCHVVPLKTQKSPLDVLTQWSQQHLNDNILPMDACHLVDKKAAEATIRVKGICMSDNDVQLHLKQGKLVTQLLLSYQELFTFHLTHELVLKSVKPLSLLDEKRQTVVTDNEVEQLDADFALMTLEMALCLQNIIQTMGGLVNLKQRQTDDITA